MFCEKYEYGFANYAADNASHTCDSDLFTFLSKLKKWSENHKKPNSDKCHLLVKTGKKS